jgi:hypothetical protein
VQHFLGAIAQLSNRFADSIIAKNTWGDGLYFVFSDVDLAGNFALQLADLVTKQNWEEKGLPRGLNLRIALHAGPVYELTIRSRAIPIAARTCRAARIEPIAPSQTRVKLWCCPPRNAHEISAAIKSARDGQRTCRCITSAGALRQRP